MHEKLHNLGWILITSVGIVVGWKADVVVEQRPVVRLRGPGGVCIINTCVIQIQTSTCHISALLLER
jgi:hypothetical protein